MPEFFGDKYDNHGGGNAATSLFCYMDIEDVTSPLSSLRKSENRGRFRKAVSELRGAVFGCHPTISVRQLDNAYDRGTPIPHIGHDCRCGDKCEDKPDAATRYHGIYITVTGAADISSIAGGYELLGGKARIFITGGTYLWMGTHPLVKVDDDFEDFQ